METLTKGVGRTTCSMVSDFSQARGKGTYRWANGSVYEGDWKDDNRHGRLRQD